MTFMRRGFNFMNAVSDCTQGQGLRRVVVMSESGHASLVERLDRGVRAADVKAACLQPVFTWRGIAIHGGRVWGQMKQVPGGTSRASSLQSR